MGTRTEDLMPAATPVARRLVRRCGSLKHILSAAVMAFEGLPPDVREVFMERAAGEPSPLIWTETQFRAWLERVVPACEEVPQDTAPVRTAKSAKAR
ncbi:MAG: hypothetical protein V2B18_25385 [Pseudomonadota bacterium]